MATLAEASVESSRTSAIYSSEHAKSPSPYAVQWNERVRTNTADSISLHPRYWLDA